MKKAFLFFCIFILGAISFAWESTMGIGFAVPQGSFNFDESDHKNIDQTAYDLDLYYLGIADNGFTLGGTFDMGLAVTDDLYGDDDDDLALDFQVLFQIGWTPIRLQKFYLGILGNIGFGWDYYSTSKTTTEWVNGYGWVDYSHKWNVNIPYATIGFDVNCNLFFTDAFGLYLKIGYRKVLSGSVAYSEQDTATDDYGDTYDYGTKYKDKYSMESSTVFQPTIGVVFKF